nr:hypothetical protein GCM10020241_23970 [Streptoalloteichus tenebrarius]
MSSTSASSAPSPSDSRTDGPERTASPEQGREQLLRRAADTAPELADLIELYYRHVPAEEVVDDRPADLVGAVRSHHEIAVSRVPGRPVVRVFNPDPTADGWSCPATVIQVVTDDMPYLVDSVAAELARRGVQVQRVVHPIVVVRRDVAGGLREVLPAADPERPPNDALAESWMLIEVDRITDPDRARELEQRLQSVLNDVREVVEDTDKMTGTARALADELERTPPPLPAAETQEGAELLRWLVDGHFTFLGYRHYELVEDPESGDKALRAVLASGLGVLRRDSLAARSFTTGPDGAAQALAPELLVLTQASAPSTVHRPVYPYYVGVKTFDADRNVTGEHRFLGVFTTSALHEDVLDIPVIERRVREVIHRAGFPLESYSGQRMLEVIQNYPRTELFSTDPDSLYDTTTGVLALAERRKLRLFLRRDPYGRFYSCLVYLPRDRYTTTTRLAMQDVLLAELQGSSLEYSARVGESALARVHFTVHTDPGRQFEPDTTRIQDKLAASVRSWDDLMIDAVLAEQHGPDGTQGVVSGESATELGQRYATLFPEAYKEDFTAGEGLADLRRLQALTGEPGDLGMHFYVPGEAEPGERRFKLYLAGQRVTLSAVLPVLQRMGVEVVDERPYEVVREDGVQCWIYDFGLRLEPAALERIAAEDPAELQARFQEAFAAAWRGDAEVDRFNALVLRAGLGWRQAALLRAYAKYLRQARTPYSQDYIEDAVLGHTQVATALVQLFETRFDPALSDETRASQGEALAAEITRMIDEVTSLDADRILRSYLTLVRATLRTNYFVTDSAGQARPFLSFKLDPQAVPDLPEPRPRFEIFVYSPRVEGVHLRFGPVARGGLRWSDRREDFRTEILGLVKAQAVKNAVIVPVGAKGGFVVKRPPTATGDPGLDREAFLKEGIACYRMFISGLLDLTDNMVGNHVVPARQVVRHDGDDAYLVVAADKGTATFSDIANEVAASYGFWLGDAFASGGSVGYDHKAMGITARGAWESVKRHFRELGVDTQSQDFTVVGVGDMSGDVFGNGMLLSEHIRLVAAFDHRHVFLDPDPNPSVSFRERKRLFELPRSSWDDYDRSKISKGGGVFPRTLKSIPVSPQVREALGLPDGVSRLSPPELIKAILLAPVDLLWNGGIGTYVKALHRDARRGRRQGQRRGPRRRGRPAGEGRRRGRQPRPDPARPDRVRQGRRQGQHRRPGQLGRRGLLRPRGQHQDPAGPHGRRGAAGAGRAQRAARRDDRRGRAPGARRQLPAERGARRQQGARRVDADRARPADQRPRTAARPGQGAGGPADAGPVQGDGPGGAGVDLAGAGHPAGPRQAGAQGGGAGQRPAGRRGVRAAAARVLPRAAAGAVRRRGRRAPAASGDHHHAAGQRGGRRGRHLLRLPAGRGDDGQRHRRRAGVLRGDQGLRPELAVAGDRRPRQRRAHRRHRRHGAGDAAAARPGLPLAAVEPAAAVGRGRRDQPVRPRGRGAGPARDRPAAGPGARRRGRARPAADRPGRAGAPGASGGDPALHLRVARRHRGGRAGRAGEAGRGAQPAGDRGAVLRVVRPPGHRPDAQLGERAPARQPLARAGAAGAARRPVRVAAGDHPGRAAQQRPRGRRRGEDRPVGGGERLPAGQGQGRAARDQGLRPAGPADAVGGGPPGPQHGPLRTGRRGRRARVDRHRSGRRRADGHRRPAPGTPPARVGVRRS